MARVERYYLIKRREICIAVTVAKKLPNKL